MKTRSSKTIANWSLGFMGIGFFSTMPFENFLSMQLLQGGFEAGLVGGLADWFAVTALFRHPLNIPIPHTALLPKNRKKITEAILNTLENDWLNKESIVGKIEQIRLTDKVLQKLEEELTNEEVQNQIIEIINKMVQQINISHFEPQLEKVIKQFLHSFNTENIVSKIIDTILENQYDEKVFNIFLHTAEIQLMDSNNRIKIKNFIFNSLKENANHGLFGFAIKSLLALGEKKLEELIDKTIDNFLHDLKNPTGKMRLNILQYIQNELKNLKTNDEFLRNIQSRKNEFVDSENFSSISHDILINVNQKIITILNDRSFFNKTIIPSIHKGILKMKNSPETIQKIENLIKKQVVSFIDHNHSKISKLVEDNLNKLNNEELTEMLEEKIGKELTWIRVNGSICGFLIGLGLTAIKMYI